MNCLPFESLSFTKRNRVTLKKKGKNKKDSRPSGASTDNNSAITSHSSSANESLLSGEERASTTTSVSNNDDSLRVNNRQFPNIPSRISSAFEAVRNVLIKRRNLNVNGQNKDGMEQETEKSNSAASAINNSAFKRQAGYGTNIQKMTRSVSGNFYSRRNYAKLDSSEDHERIPLPHSTSAQSNVYYTTAGNFQRRSDNDSHVYTPSGCTVVSTTTQTSSVEMTVSSPSEMDCEDLGQEETEDWDDEELTCNVCDRSFATPKLLERHQQKRRHWSCNACERLFDSLMQLEHHKEEYEHWSSSSCSDEYEEQFEEQLEQMELQICSNTGDYNRGDISRSDQPKATGGERWYLNRKSRSAANDQCQETAFGPDMKEETEMLLP